MTTDFILPDIGEGIVECELVEWLVKEGDVIAEDQAVAEVMTDKALVQIPSMYDGKVAKLYYQKGDIAKVHSPLFAISITTGDNAEASEQTTEESTPAVTIDEPVESVVNNNTDGQFDPPVAIEHRAIASPAVRRLAKEQDIDLTAINGSGKKGRILKCDLAQPAETKDSAVAAIERVKLTAVQSAMAKQMSLSVTTIPHFTYCDQIQMDALIAARQQIKANFESRDVKLTLMPFMIKALSLALKETPILNSQFDQQSNEIVYQSSHNIGFAVASKIGLVVPNIKNVQDKSLFDIAVEMNEIIAKAREGRLGKTELTGGTITVSNIGVIGGTVATPIINHPEVAIVALGQTNKLPRYNDKGDIEPVQLMDVSWSADHRIIDGATMATFNQQWKSLLQQPMLMLSQTR